MLHRECWLVDVLIARPQNKEPMSPALLRANSKWAMLNAEVEADEGRAAAATAAAAEPSGQVQMSYARRAWLFSMCCAHKGLV